MAGQICLEKVIKAANTRAAAPLFRDLARRCFPTDRPVDVWVRRLTANFAELYEILYEAPIFVPQAALERLKVVTVEIGEDWMRLHDHAQRNNRLQWQVTPKVHRLQHVPFYASILNPRHTQCYAEESLIGTTSQVWQTTMRGKYESSAQSVVLAKRTLGLFLRFES